MTSTDVMGIAAGFGGRRGRRERDRSVFSKTRTKQDAGARLDAGFATR
jgi:hypothetical protein